MKTYINDFFRRSIRIIHRIEAQKKIPILSLFGKYAHFKLLNWAYVLSVKYKYIGKCKKGTLKKVTLVFNGDVCNAGLADRLRSMTSVYYWCKKNCIQYDIFFNEPFCISDYLEPNLYDWRNLDCELNYFDAYPKALISFIGTFGKDENNRLHCKYLDSLLNLGYEHIHLYTNTFCYDDYFKEKFHELFKVNKQLELELTKMKNQIGGKYITISYRFAQLLGDLKDTFGTPLSPRQREELIIKMKESIHQIVKQNGVDKCVVTSDSITFLEAISELPYVYILPGTVGHISNDVSSDQVRKTFWDMFMISRAEKAYMVRTSIMYKSGFAMRAAMIGNIPFEEVMIE